MCIFLKFDYTKSGVSNLFFRKGIEEKPLKGSARLPPPPPPPPIGKGRVNSF